MKQHKIGGLEFLSYGRFEPFRGVSNIVTTRTGGKSRGPYESLNLGLHVGDDPDAVLENRAVLARALGVEPEALTIPAQVHGTGVAIVEPGRRGGGAVSDEDTLPKADAVVTHAADVPLVVLIADCVAVSLYDPRRQVIGLAHAGWKGTLGRIAERTVRAMEEAFGCRPGDIVAGVGPSIGRGHYEVGEDVFDAYVKAFGRGWARQFVQEDMDGTCYLDLWASNEAQLLGCGVPRENIAVSEMCTACHPHLFYSHRHEGGKTGRFAAVIMRHASTSRQY